MKGDEIKLEDQNLIITHTAFSHNHQLTKKLLIKAKIATHQYTIHPEVQLSLLQMMEAGPILTNTLRNFIQKQFPENVNITAQMICNVRMQVQRLKKNMGMKSR